MYKYRYLLFFSAVLGLGIAAAASVVLFRFMSNDMSRFINFFRGF